MMFNKLMLSGLIAAAMISSFGANATDGTINFKGKVLDTPCGLTAASANQTIDFGQLSKTHLDTGGESKHMDVDINLTNCEVGHSVQAAFNGATIAGKTDELGTAGKTGTSISMSSSDGNAVKFDGTDVAAQTLKLGANDLHFTAWVQKASGATNVVPGDFSSVANFTLTYK